MNRLNKIILILPYLILVIPLSVIAMEAEKKTTLYIIPDRDHHSVLSKSVDLQLTNLAFKRKISYGCESVFRDSDYECKFVKMSFQKIDKGFFFGIEDFKAFVFSRTMMCYSHALINKVIENPSENFMGFVNSSNEQLVQEIVGSIQMESLFKEFEENEKKRLTILKEASVEDKDQQKKIEYNIKKSENTLLVIEKINSISIGAGMKGYFSEDEMKSLRNFEDMTIWSDFYACFSNYLIATEFLKDEIVSKEENLQFLYRPVSESSQLYGMRLINDLRNKFIALNIVKLFTLAKLGKDSLYIKIGSGHLPDLVERIKNLGYTMPMEIIECEHVEEHLKAHCQ